MDESTSVRLVALGRCAAGTALLVAPGVAVRAWTGRRPSATERMAARGLGGRDLAIGVGTLASLGRPEAAAGWLGAGALADAADALGTLTSWTQLGRGRRVLLLSVEIGAALTGARHAARARR